MFTFGHKMVNAHKDAVTNVGWTSSDRIVTTGLDGCVCVWDGRSYEPIGTLDPLHYLGIVKLSIWGDRAATNSIDGSGLYLWNICDQVLEQKIACSPVECWKHCWVSGDKLATSSLDKKLHFWDRNSKTRTIELGCKFICDICPTLDEKYLAVGTENGAIHIVDVEQGCMVQTFLDHTKPVRKVIFSPDSRRLYTGGDGCSIYVYDMGTRDCIGSLEGHSSWILSLDLHGDYLASCSGDGQVKVWKIDTMECLETFGNHSREAWDVAFSPDGTRLVSVSSDQQVHIYSSQ